MKNVTYRKSDCFYNETERSVSMKVLIPKQHGAWAMLLIPICLGMVKGGPVLWHIPLFTGWLFLYLTVYPITLAVKKKKQKTIKNGFLLRHCSLLLYHCGCHP